MLRTSTFVVVATTVALLAGCASNAGKYSFTADDFEMGYVDSKNNERNLKELDKQINAQFSSLDLAFAQVDALTKPLPDMVKMQVGGQVTNIKGMVNKQVKGRALDICHQHGPELVSYLASYDVFSAKDSKVGYDLIDPLKEDDDAAKDINPLIEQANALLKSSYKVTKQFAVDKQLLDLARKDLKSVKETNDVTKLAGIGIVTVSVARSSMACMKDAQALAPKMQGLFDTLQSKIKANPALALKLGGTAGQLGGVTANLLSVTTDVPGVLGSVTDILKDFGS